MHVRTGACGGQKSASDSLGTGVIVDCEPPDVGSKDQTWVLCKSSTCS